MPSTSTATLRMLPEAQLPEAKALAVVLQDEFETPFRFYDAAQGELRIIPGHQEHAWMAAPDEVAAVLELGAEGRPTVVVLPDGRYLLGFPLDGNSSSRLVAVGVVDALARTRPEAEREQARLEKWIRSVHGRLNAAREVRECRRGQAEQDRQSLVPWEAIMGLDRLHRSLRIDAEPARDRRRILRVAGELLGVQSLAWVCLQPEEDVAHEGERLLSPWDSGQLAGLLTGHASADKSGYVMFNDASEASWGARFPRIQNLLAVPVAENKLSGWVLAFNKRRLVNDRGSRTHANRTAAHGDHEPPQMVPFRRSDAALLMPFASLLALQTRSAQRYQCLKDLLVGLTRSLTAAIDAKDHYTYGHSERVARAAVELGRALGLQEAELSDIYLAGLLHDIGKIGIRDDVLCKRGPLTPDEMKHIQQHPVIGHRILAGLHPIAHLLPGVLYHHERYDGNGYPEGLRGDGIPLLARILAVADSFDAMNTSRPYRTAMPPDRVDQILREGAGTQWDPLVIDAYLRCRDRLISIRQRGLGESLRDALDGALRNGSPEIGVASLEMSIHASPQA